MSGSDIRDILQLGRPSESPAVKKMKQPAERRPDGISRELYSLIGGSPSVALVKPTYKAKFNVKKKATPWVLEQFSNNARSDDMLLRHWIKATDANRDEYPFAYTKKPDGGWIWMDYTDEEYDKYLAHIDPEWSREETDYLMHLCREYNLRFIVIADRYSYKDKARSMEDLKDRYYSICRTLAKERSSEKGDVGVALYQYAFDKAREVERKQALATLSGRTKAQMDEEEALLVEVRRMEQNDARLAREKEAAMHLLAQFPASRGDTSSAAANPEGKKRRRSAISDSPKKPRRAPSMSEEPMSPKEKLVPGVHVQSQRLPPLTRGAMHTKVLKVMDEVGVGPRPVMPTAAVCQGFEQLQASIAAMFELKKVVDKMDMEHRVKSHNGKLPNRRKP